MNAHKDSSIEESKMDKKEDSSVTRQLQKRTFWSTVFSALDLMNIKQSILKSYIFKPPRSPTYQFSVDPQSKKDDVEDDIQFNFQLLGTPSDFKSAFPISAVQLFSLRNSVAYMTPVVHIRTSSTERSKRIIIYSHGNNSDLGNAFWTCYEFVESLQFDVISYDYTGYGISPRIPSEEMIYQDLETVLSYVVAELGYQLWEIYLWGFSLGSGPTVEIAKKYATVCGVILNSPLASCLAWLDKSPEKPFMGYKGPDLFSNITKISDIQTKILIMHGEGDRIIPCAHSKSLFQKLKTNRKAPEDNTSNEWLLLIPEADHNDIPAIIASPSSELRKKIKGLLDFMYAAKKMEKRNAKGDLKMKYKQEPVDLQQIFQNIRINHIGTWKKNEQTEITKKKTETGS